MRLPFLLSDLFLSTMPDDSIGIKALSCRLELIIKTPANRAKTKAKAVTTPATAPELSLQSWLWQEKDDLVFLPLTLLEEDPLNSIEGGGDFTELAVGFIKVVLDVTNDSSLRDQSERQHIPDHQIGLLPVVDELTRVYSLDGDENLILLPIPKRTVEADVSRRGTATRIVDDLGDDTLEVAVALVEVEAPKTGRTLAVVGV
ncbi:hypothetical protein TB2_040848 [Malus domestica]|uniref:Uncharacterized protein n=1 Tax=Malus domestica TaxID=3750 RepID=A0A498JBM4_MALDO|nr:hypothetical protein DVH24_011914 [Malus domestica]